MSINQVVVDARTEGRNAIIAEGRRILLHEAEALRGLAEALDEAFFRVVEALSTVTGKVVVSGMGKSGHIGRKIAATLASTGTPSFFVHPGEAAHGDLGMIGPQDAVLMLSNSGESTELMQVAAYARKLGIISVVITSKPTSRLGEAAGMVLEILDIPEACASNIAPSNSTTMALALGDALALTLMRKRGFGRIDFARLHPGGKLGLRLSSVAELMLQGDALPLVTETANAHETIVEMTVKRLGATGVVDNEGRLTGIITDGDLRRSFERPHDWSARDIMTRSPMMVDGKTNAENALAFMNSRGVSVLFVFDAAAPDIPVGIIHLHHFIGLGLG